MRLLLSTALLLVSIGSFAHADISNNRGTELANCQALDDIDIERGRGGTPKFSGPAIYEGNGVFSQVLYTGATTEIGYSENEDGETVPAHHGHDFFLSNDMRIVDCVSNRSVTFVPSYGNAPTARLRIELQRADIRISDFNNVLEFAKGYVGADVQRSPYEAILFETTQSYECGCRLYYPDGIDIIQGSDQ